MTTETAMTAPPAAAQEITPLTLMHRALENPEFDPNKLSQLMELQERWEARQAERAFNEAFSQWKALNVQPRRLSHVKYETSKGSTDFWHDDVGITVQEVNRTMADFGLSVRWSVTTPNSDTGTRITVQCIIAHRDGHSFAVSMSAAPDASGGKNSIQAVGSTVRYLQRYTLNTACGMAPPGKEDEGVLPISDEEAQEIRDGLAAKGREEEAFCKWLHRITRGRTTTIEAIPRNMYGRVMMELDLAPQVSRKTAQLRRQMKQGEDGGEDGGDE